MRASVAVPGPVRRLFTYDVPPALAPRCHPGARVLVPFGRRQLTAYVVEVDEGEPSHLDPVRNLRPVAQVLDAVPALDTDLLELTRWASVYYAASWGEMIRSALPGMQAPTRRELALTEAGARTLAAPPTRRVAASGGAMAAILGAVGRAAGEPGHFVGLAEVRRQAGRPVTSVTLRAMARSGLIEMREVMTRTGPVPRFETWVVPGTGAAPSPPAGPDERPATRRAPGPRQAMILEQLAAAPAGGVRSADLLRATGATHAALRSLEAAGRLRLEPRVVARRPLALQAASASPEIPPVPTADQASAIGAIKAAVEERRFATFLLFGVTGSGKTEVYLRVIESALAEGRQAIYLVPEIGLTPLLARRMQARFGEVLALLHSGLSDGERQDEWRRAREGKVRVVLGARSAVFAPLPDPGVVIVDEEHDASYKQDEHPRYNGRDLAIVRAKMKGAAVVLGSATPSMESYQHALEGKYQLLTLPQRVGGSSLPVVHRVDMRREFEEAGRESVLSRRLVEALRERLAKGEQSLVLLNRRGFSTFVLCRACGQPIECRSCSITLTLHLKERRLRCHYCNDSRAVPSACPACGSGHLHFGGTGTERLEETLKSFLPGARLQRLDRDTARGRGAVEAILWRVERGEVDVLLGTQMIAKGHDFPNVTLVGVLGADALLGMPDFRAGERTFQLLAQVAGRSGRRETPGEVIVQAWDPDHHAVRAACEHDFEAFAKDELAYRRTLGYPPFSSLALLVFRDRVFETARAHAHAVASGLRRAHPPDLQVMGPAPAPLERLRGEFRVQVLLKGRTRAAVRHGIAEAVTLIERRRLRPDAVTIDVDPASTQ
jgi:primosomal protein N' (replication factor Y) (superfamily II helicase)